MKKKTLNQCVKVTFRGLFQQEKKHLEIKTEKNMSHMRP